MSAFASDLKLVANSLRFMIADMLSLFLRVQVQASLWYRRWASASCL